MSEKAVKVGDRFWRPRRRSHDGDWMEVYKVGRDYFYVGYASRPETNTRYLERYYVETGLPESNNSGRLYANEEEYREAMLCDDLWNEFRRSIFSRPRTVSR